MNELIILIITYEKQEDRIRNFAGINVMYMYNIILLKS